MQLYIVMHKDMANENVNSNWKFILILSKRKAWEEISVKAAFLNTWMKIINVNVLLHYVCIWETKLHFNLKNVNIEPP